MFIMRVLRRLFIAPQSRKNGTFTYRSSFNQYNQGSRSAQKNFDHIEEADFEEIKDKKTNKE